MGSRGPKPQPIAILKAKGTINVTRANDQIADANALDFVHEQIPTPPEDLNEQAKNIWNGQLMQAQKMYGYISYIDLSLFKEYCYVYAEMEWLKDNVKSRTYTDDKGTIRVDPLYTELNKLRKDFLRLSQEFGFSPSARTRIQLQQKPETNTDIYSDGI
jgi:P27 family predicted phage terminase small subunit